MISKKPKILLVEDDMDLARGWEELFDLLGYQVHSEPRALSVIENFEAIEAFDLLISDYYLPDINGIELIKRVRELRPDIPAILLTGSRDPGIVEAVEKIARCELVYKPVNIEELESRVEAFFPNCLPADQSIK